MTFDQILIINPTPINLKSLNFIMFVPDNGGQMKVFGVAVTKLNPFGPRFLM